MTKEEKKSKAERALSDANQAKDRLYDIVCELEELGYKRKAKACMNLIYKIEAWQNSSL